MATKMADQVFVTVECQCTAGCGTDIWVTPEERRQINKDPSTVVVSTDCEGHPPAEKALLREEGDNYQIFGD